MVRTRLKKNSIHPKTLNLSAFQESAISSVCVCVCLLRFRVCFGTFFKENKEHPKMQVHTVEGTRKCKCTLEIADSRNLEPQVWGHQKGATLICSNFSGFLYFAPICVPCLVESPICSGLFRFALVSSGLSDLFSEQIRTNQETSFCRPLCKPPRNGCLGCGCS